eukprot:jgi/Astpho2/6961/Aster-x1410
MLQDLAYIDWLVSLHPGVYRKRTPQRKQNATEYDGLWEGLQPDRFYVKQSRSTGVMRTAAVMEQQQSLHLPEVAPCSCSSSSQRQQLGLKAFTLLVAMQIDDDIVFIQEGAIQALLNEKLTNDRFLFTSANVINHPILSSVHAHLGALTNFEPHSLSNNNWRRVPGAFNLDRGPCVKKENASHWWSTWECAALAHFSFFRNFQAGRMQDFTFGVWDFHADSYVRWSINFFLFRSSEMPPITLTDDEHEIAVVVPKKRRQHCGALGAAVVSHFSYYPQRQGLLDNTNILEQYEELARLHLPECSSL